MVDNCPTTESDTIAFFGGRRKPSSGFKGIEARLFTLISEAKAFRSMRPRNHLPLPTLHWKLGTVSRSVKHPGERRSAASHLHLAFILSLLLAGCLRIRWSDGLNIWTLFSARSVQGTILRGYRAVCSAIECVRRHAVLAYFSAKNKRAAVKCFRISIALGINRRRFRSRFPDSHAVRVPHPRRLR